jgi:hypothetical protein
LPNFSLKNEGLSLLTPILFSIIRLPIFLVRGESDYLLNFPYKYVGISLDITPINLSDSFGVLISVPGLVLLIIAAIMYICIYIFLFIYFFFGFIWVFFFRLYIIILLNNFFFLFYSMCFFLRLKLFIFIYFFFNSF